MLGTVHGRRRSDGTSGCCGRTRVDAGRQIEIAAGADRYWVCVGDCPERMHMSHQRCSNAVYQILCEISRNRLPCKGFGVYVGVYAYTARKSPPGLSRNALVVYMPDAMLGILNNKPRLTNWRGLLC